MQIFWEDFEANDECKNFIEFQENAVKDEQTIILRPSVCSPLQ